MDVVEQLASSGSPLDRAIRQVLLRVGLNMVRAAEDAPNLSLETIEAGLDWLSGAAVEPERSERLGFGSKDPLAEGLRDDQDVERVFRLLADMSLRGGRPFVLALDQFDNLTEEQVRATARFFHVLVDHTPNLLCILSGVDSNIIPLVDDGVISEANWDRVAEDQVRLPLISPELAKRVILGRIEKFRAPFGKLPEVERAVEKDPFFPLESRTFDDKLGSALRVRPRQMIRWAREAWEREAERCEGRGVSPWLATWPEGHEGPPPIPWEKVVDEVVARKRQEQDEMRLEHRGSLPPDPANVEELLFRLVERVAVADPNLNVEAVERPTKGPYALVLQEDDGRSIGVAVVMTSHAQSSTRQLGKLVVDPDPPSRVILLTDEERRPLRQTDRALQHLEALRARGEGFDWLKLSFAAHAYVDALVSVLLQAAAGDIEVDYGNESRSLSESDVLDSYRRTAVLSSGGPLQVLFTRAIPSSGSGSGGGGARIRLADPTLDPGLPSPAECAGLLLQLGTAPRGTTAREAAQKWCRERGQASSEEAIERRFHETAVRLRLFGRLVLLNLSGVVRLSCWGRWPSVI